MKRAAMTVATLLISSMAEADISANIGWASDYYFRGILQKQSSASGGIDLDHNGFYVGTWIADVDGPFGDGLEVDGYFGYAGEVQGVAFAAGYTGYFYTGDFDDTYQEINLSGGYGIATLDVAVGEYNNFGGPTQDYLYYQLTVEKNGLFGRYGAFSRDFSGEFIEFGYGTTVSEIDLGLSLLLSDEKLSGGVRNEALVFTIGKTFDLN